MRYTSSMTQAEALTILKTGANVYLTGEPGSGKSYTIGMYVAYLREHQIEPAITASTGIAATHIQGMTVHSWSGIGVRKTLTDYEVDQIATNEYVARRIGRTKVLIIDEISMLDSRTLDMVDRVCREVKHIDEPFGGIQTILVGDFFQLPPVSKDESEFAFQSNAWQSLNLVICYLHEQHRQEDKRFLSFLSAMRANRLEEHHNDYLSERVTHYDDIPTEIPKLFPHNADVDRLNNQALEQLTTDSHTYQMESEGAPALVASLTRSCLSPETLKLKIGASVMFTKNNSNFGYVNGTLGTVIGFDAYNSNPIIETRDGRTITAEPAEWVIEENGKIRARIVQVPLRLAWAMTVHKSQGMSLDAAVMDLSGAFEYGQGYVALSRVRSLSGLYLIGWNERSLQVHPEILEQDDEFRAQSLEAEKGFAKLGQAELQTMWENFIIASGGVLMPKKIKKEKKPKPVKVRKGNTFDETLKLLKEKKKISEISKTRELVEQTIYGHMERLYDEGKLSEAEVMAYVPKKIIDDLPIIQAAFVELQTVWLGPVHEFFDGRYTYNDIRLAKMLFADKAKYEELDQKRKKSE